MVPVPDKGITKYNNTNYQRSPMNNDISDKTKKWDEETISSSAITET